MTPLATGDTPPPVRDANALLSSYVSAGSRPRERLLSPASFPREEPTNSRSFLPPPPPFEAPAAGSCKIAIAVQQTGNTRVAIPVVYAVQSSGAHVVFPFTRQLLGVVWRTVAELEARVFRDIVEGDHASLLARRMALPVEVVLMIASSLEAQAARSCTTTALEEWRKELLSPNSPTRFSLACMECGVFPGGHLAPAVNDSGCCERYRLFTGPTRVPVRRSQLTHNFLVETPRTRAPTSNA